MGTSRVVYRALVGGYEQLREEPVALETDIPFICITDDPDLTSETWTIVLADPRIPQDPTRSARALKILGHPTLDDFDQTLWVDNTVERLRSPDELFDIWLEHADVAAPLHSYRASVLGEAEAVINEGLDDFARVYEQITHYLSLDPVGVEENPHWTGILARRRLDVTAAAMQTWWEHVLRYSRRDQLSFVTAMRSQGVRLNSVPLDSFGSQWHRWPRAVGATAPRRPQSARGAAPPASRIGELEEALSEATQTLARAEAAREELITSAQAEVRLGRDLLAQREPSCPRSRSGCTTPRAASWPSRARSSAWVGIARRSGCSSAAPRSVSVSSCSRWVASPRGSARYATGSASSSAGSHDSRCPRSSPYAAGCTGCCVAHRDAEQVDLGQRAVAARVGYLNVPSSAS